jgi:hypothetical protein
MKPKFASLSVAMLMASLLVANSATASTLIGYWSGDGNPNDTSGYGNNGSFSGSYATGYGQADAFNLATGFVVIPNSASYSFGADHSVTFLFNANGQGGGTFLGEDDGGGDQNKWFIDYGYTGGHFELHNNGASGPVFLQSNPVALPSGWNRFTLVEIGSVFSFYLNGVAIGSDNFTGPYATPSAPLVFGYTEPGVPTYTGLIEDVALYDGAINATPLPATWTMMLIGLAGLGFFAYRRQKQDTGLAAA